jgi:hypothetical protein
MRHRRRRPEDQIQRAVLEHLRIRGPRDAFTFAVPNGGWRSAIEASIMKGLGVRAGVPDLMIVHAGKIFGLELKAERGRPTTAQLEAHAALRRAGAEVEVAVGIDAALQQLEIWQLLKGRSSC